MLDDTIIIYIMFSGVAIIGVLAKVCIKSKCDKVELLGCLKVHRDIKAEEDLELANGNKIEFQSI